MPSEVVFRPRKRRTRRLVLRPSTSAEIADIFSRLEYQRWSSLRTLRHFAVDLLEIRLHPSHAGDFNLPILRDPEQRRNIGQSISIRDRIVVSVIQQDGKCHAKLAHK